MSVSERIQPVITTARRKARAIHYPTSDGKPMAETDLHRDQMVDDISGLKIRYTGRNDVYVSGNNFIYYEEGNPKKCLSPDVYVVLGVGPQQRDCYKVWEEDGHLPNVVFEHTSRKTRNDDVNKKLPLYKELLKIPEIFYFDPRADYLRPERLRGFRLTSDGYVELHLIDGRMHSQQLNLDLVVQGNRLRLYDPVRDEWIHSGTEYARLAREEARRRREVERELEQESQRAEQESQRAERAEAELERLRELLKATEPNPK